MIVEETLIREPNLLIPGKKPIGPVRVDPQFPNIIRASFLSDRFLDGSADYVDRVVGTKWLGTAREFQLFSKADPRSGIYLAGTYSSGSEQSELVTADYDLSGATQLGLIIRVRFSGSEGTDGYVLSNNLGTVNRLWSYYNVAGGYFRVTLRAKAQYLDRSWPVATGVWYTIVYNWHGGTEYSCFANGLDLGAGTNHSTGSPTDFGAGTYEGWHLDCRSNINTLNTPQDLASVFISDKAFNKQLSASLSVDPYQFLIPA